MVDHVNLGMKYHYILLVDGVIDDFTPEVKGHHSLMLCFFSEGTNADFGNLKHSVALNMLYDI